MTNPPARNDDASEYTKQYYDDAKIDRMVRESAYYIDDDQTNARQHLVAIIRQLRTERDAERLKNTPPPAEPPARPAPSAVDLDAVRARLDAITPSEWISQYDKVWNDRFLRVIVEDTPYGLPSIVAASISSVADAEFIAHAPSDIRALVAEVGQLRREVHRCHSKIGELEGEIERLEAILD